MTTNTATRPASTYRFPDTNAQMQHLALLAPPVPAPGPAPGSWAARELDAYVPAKASTVAPQSAGTVDRNNPVLKKLATSALSNGRTGWCVETTLNNMHRLGIPNTPSYTSNDNNNPRGAMVQMLRKGWTSVPLPGSHQERISSPYGTVTANAVTKAQYEKLVAAGKVPDGAVIFQTRTGWNYSGGSKGNDMGIVRNGGKTTHNYQDMTPGIVYGDCKSVVILVPQGAVK